ncbi:RsmB/NOP family class I SAM-dependent RNA methyltransferase [Luteolibacter sp. AS25]|uniref:RsmB/NOP family class I SAM-dependent RNA methyltransferase n=1 Tax=Luteolibacter sp. AS25 TaxID=3135776 RepID=UPI00398AE6E3
MKLHRHLCASTLDLAKAVLLNHRVLDHELAAAFENNKKWGKRDRSFVAETLFEVTRWRRSLSYLVDSDDTNSLITAQWVLMGFELPEWHKYTGRPPEEIIARQADIPDQPRAIRQSIPDWMDKLGYEELGEQWEPQLTALNQKPSVFLRVNTLLCTLEEAQEWLAENNVETAPVDGHPYALALPPGKILPKALRLDGRIEIQDPSSQQIAPFLDPQPGQRIIDACSGAGGKALHLAALSKNEARIYAMDVDEKKLAQLKQRAKRARATCIVQKAIIETTPTDFADIADSLIIDSPCSGLGTLKRQPDLKWRLKPAALKRVQSIQAQLLAEYPKMLRSGGKLLYATCSILPSENQEQIARLLKNNPDKYRLISQQNLLPSETGHDGFHASLLEKL